MSSWAPEEGAFSSRYFENLRVAQRLSSHDVDRVREQSLDILRRCVNPHGDDCANAGLVIGHVQSGKTLSFTSVAALARDNGFHLVIVLAGYTNNLRAQSAERLKRDLAFTRHGQEWKIFDTPDADAFVDIRRRIDDKRKARPFDHETVVITVLKNYQRINALADELAFLDLSGIPTLVIDDEADQASLNTLAAANLKNDRAHDKDVSRTYDAIRNLRAVLPLHTFLEYTATPQAVMLVTVLDSLSPDWAVTITPGAAYTGGRDFFVDSKDQIVRTVPDEDVFDPAEPPEELPESLLLALATFILVCAQHKAARESGNRTMMIQPHNTQDPHSRFGRLVRHALETYAMFDTNPLGLREQFAEAYDDLDETTTQLQPLDELLHFIPRLAASIAVAIVNSGPDRASVDFDQHPYYILVGGMLLDRGFTVEGLTVTYMPRFPNTGADTMQQRARFFGYRKNYLHYCRVYLPEGLNDAMTEYVRAEEGLRSEIDEHRLGSIKEWRRRLEQPAQLQRLVRSNVISMNVSPVTDESGWEWPRHLHEVAAINGPMLDDFYERLKRDSPPRSAFSIAGIVDERSDRPEHEWFPTVPKAKVLTMIASLAHAPQDRDLLERIRGTLEQPRFDAIDVIALDRLSTRRERGGRSLRVLQDNPFRGRSNLGDREQYVGERDIRHHDIRHTTLQLRRVTVKDVTTLGGNPLETVWFALHFPRGMRRLVWKQIDP